MKRTLYVLALVVAVSIPLHAGAQLAAGKITIGNLVVNESDSRVGVDFTVKIGKGAVRRNHTYVFNPVLTDGTFRVGLPAVVVEGGGTKIVRARQNWVSGIVPEYEEAFYTSPGNTVDYHAIVEAQSWMHGGQLLIEGVAGGCCDYRSEQAMTLAENLHLYDEPEPTVIVTEIKRFAPLSVGDSLSMAFPFVMPESMFDPEDPYKIYDDERDPSMVVYFHQGKHDILTEYRNNAQTLINLSAALDIILTDTLSVVERIVVAGFASPEGTVEFNESLAFDRGAAVKKYLVDNTHILDGQVWVYNGGVDWKGLRLLVSRSDMPEKGEIISIIDNIPVRDDDKNTRRLDELRKLHGGAPYKYMFDNFFPLLRNGAFFKVYYSNTM